MGKWKRQEAVATRAIDWFLDAKTACRPALYSQDCGGDGRADCWPRSGHSVRQHGHGDVMNDGGVADACRLPVMAQPIDDRPVPQLRYRSWNDARLPGSVATAPVTLHTGPCRSWSGPLTAAARIGKAGRHGLTAPRSVGHSHVVANATLSPLPRLLHRALVRRGCVLSAFVRQARRGDGRMLQRQVSAGIASHDMRHLDEVAPFSAGFIEYSIQIKPGMWLCVLARAAG